MPREEKKTQPFTHIHTICSLHWHSNRCTSTLFVFLFWFSRERERERVEAGEGEINLNKKKKKKKLNLGKVQWRRTKLRMRDRKLTHSSYCCFSVPILTFDTLYSLTENTCFIIYVNSKKLQSFAFKRFSFMPHSFSMWLNFGSRGT